MAKILKQTRRGRCGPIWYRVHHIAPSQSATPYLRSPDAVAAFINAVGGERPILPAPAKRNILSGILAVLSWWTVGRAYAMPLQVGQPHLLSQPNLGQWPCSMHLLLQLIGKSRVTLYASWPYEQMTSHAALSSCGFVRLLGGVRVFLVAGLRLHSCSLGVFTAI